MDALGMPLQAEQKAAGRSRRPDRLHDAVRGPGQGLEARGDGVDGLVVRGIAAQLAATEDVGERGVGRHADRVDIFGRGVQAAVLAGAGEVVGKVAIKLTAGRDIDDLAAEADA